MSRRSVPGSAALAVRRTPTGKRPTTTHTATATALIDALDKHNAREPDRRAIFLNYSAVDPSLTNERCSFWHFRFDAHADMRLARMKKRRADQRARIVDGLMSTLPLDPSARDQVDQLLTVANANLAAIGLLGAIDRLARFMSALRIPAGLRGEIDASRVANRVAMKAAGLPIME